MRHHMPLATYPNPPRTTVSVLFGLAPGGLPCPVRYHAGGVLLPHHFTLTSFLAVSFLLHFPWTYAPQALPGTLVLWSPDFPPGPRVPAIVQPARPAKPSLSITPNHSKR